MVHLVIIPPGEGVLDMSNEEEMPGQTQDTVVGLYLLAGLALIFP